MRIEIQVVNAASPALRSLAKEGVSDARRRMVDQGMSAALASTIRLNPVRTGRSRAAWSAALEHLGGTPSRMELSGPAAEGAAKGSLSREDGERTTAVSATNAVSYVPFLEYGTSKMSPFAMVRRSLAVVQRLIGGWFRLS
jgi:hypothetical protein